MTAPNRSADVAAWVASHRALFTGDADTKTRELLTPLARHLNVIEGRNVWGVLVKSERNPPFIPHDILMWKDTREHFDVFTGPDSGRAEDVQAVWGYNAAPSDARWIWQSVEGDVVEPPVDPPTDDLEIRVATLEGLIGTLEQQTARTWESIADIVNKLADRITALENKPAPTFELPALIAKGNTGRVWGHGHPVTLEVRKK